MGYIASTKSSIREKRWVGQEKLCSLKSKAILPADRATVSDIIAHVERRTCCESPRIKWRGG